MAKRKMHSATMLIRQSQTVTFRFSAPFVLQLLAHPLSVVHQVSKVKAGTHLPSSRALFKLHSWPQPFSGKKGGRMWAPQGCLVRPLQVCGASHLWMPLMQGGGWSMASTTSSGPLGIRTLSLPLDVCFIMQGLPNHKGAISDMDVAGLIPRRAACA
jgi:hypothetical protein